MNIYDIKNSISIKSKVKLNDIFKRIRILIGVIFMVYNSFKFSTSFYIIIFVLIIMLYVVIKKKPGINVLTERVSNKKEVLFHIFMKILILIYGISILFYFYSPTTNIILFSSNLKKYLSIIREFTVAIIILEFFFNAFSANEKHHNWKALNKCRFLNEYVCSAKGSFDLIIILVFFISNIIDTGYQMDLKGHFIYVCLQEVLLLKLIRYRKFLLKKCVVFLYLYLLVWFLFGLQYNTISIITGGNDFIFQQDIMRRVQYDNIKQHIENISIPDNIIDTLISNGNLDKKVENTHDIHGTQVAYCPTTLGKDWANFYEKYYILKNIKYFNINISKDIKWIPFKSEDKNGIYSGSKGLHLVDIYLYSDNNSIQFSFPDMRLNDDTYKIKFMPSKSLYNDALIKFKITVGLDSIYNLENDIASSKSLDFSEIISQSLEFPDDTYNILKNDIKNNQNQFSMADFLYFSGITITTVGYGDILPNSTYVRSLVMLETFLGLLLVVMYAPLIFRKDQQFLWLKKLINSLE